jgi:hypothetical protein
MAEPQIVRRALQFADLSLSNCPQRRGLSRCAKPPAGLSRLVDLETLEGGIPAVDAQAQLDQWFSAAILLDLIRRLKPLDRQIILLYLEGEAAQACKIAITPDELCAMARSREKLNATSAEPY